jgi:hypothetical protein
MGRCALSLRWLSRETSLSRMGPARIRILSPGVAITLVSFVEGWSSGSRRASHWLATIPRLNKQAARPSVSAPILTVGLQGEAWSSASLQRICRTDHRRDGIGDFIAGVHHEIRPQVFLDRPFGRRPACAGGHIRPVREADPACDDLFNETPSIRLAGRVWAHRTARRTFNFSFQSKAPALITATDLLTKLPRWSRLWLVRRRRTSPVRT